MKICFLPIDNRPVCYNLVKDIVAIDDDIELYLPPRDFLGDLTKYSTTFKYLSLTLLNQFSNFFINNEEKITIAHKKAPTGNAFFGFSKSF